MFGFRSSPPREKKKKRNVSKELREIKSEKIMLQKTAEEWWFDTLDEEDRQAIVGVLPFAGRMIMKASPSFMTLVQSAVSFSLLIPPLYPLVTGAELSPLLILPVLLSFGIFKGVEMRSNAGLRMKNSLQGCGITVLFQYLGNDAASEEAGGGSSEQHQLPLFSGGAGDASASSCGSGDKNSEI